MITNKDLSIDSKNGQVILNGDKYDLGTQGEIDAAVKDVYSVMGEMGAKNLIPYPYYETTKEINDVVVTDNGDGTLTFNGTASANTTVFKYLNNDAAIKIPLERRKYKLTFGTDQGTSGFHLGDYRIVKTDNTTQTVNVTGDTIIDNTNGDYLGINAMSVYVAKNKALNNVTIYPMLRLAEDTDNTYQPYAMTNKQLTEKVEEYVDTAISYIDKTINAETSGHAAPVRSSGGSYYEPLADYTALGVTREKVLGIFLISWTGVTKEFSICIGTSAISALTNSETSIYATDPTANIVLRVIYKR